MPDKWYTSYMAELKQTPVGCHMVITAEDINRSRVRALEKASAAALALASVPSITFCVSLVPQSGGPSILTGASAEH